MTTNKDYYEILGVGKSVSATDLKKAYRRLALEWHPDRNKSSEAEKRFKEINEAYEVLSDSKKRQAYDQFGHAAFTPGGAPPPGGSGGSPFGFGGFGPFTYTYRTSGSRDGSSFEGFDFSDPFQIFEEFFGFTSPFGRSAHMPHVSITIDFMDSFKGIEKEVVIGAKKRKIKIPPGVDDGSRIRFADFFATINVRPHKTFQREGDDVFVDVEIPLVIAITGGEVDIPVLEGETKIRVKLGTQPGTMLRLSGRGMPRLRGRGRGDFYVRLHINIPKYSDLTLEQRNALDLF
ncbi:MAG: DnaJ domain-containing protein [Candidatus Blackburnbacteria bacterium]|nr:DnaJ domain-containing protein [Candidatus Blackburnbacteria bacterium]